MYRKVTKRKSSGGVDANLKVEKKIKTENDVKVELLNCESCLTDNLPITAARLNGRKVGMMAEENLDFAHLSDVGLSNLLYLEGIGKSKGNVKSRLGIIVKNEETSSYCENGNF